MLAPLRAGVAVAQERSSRLPKRQSWQCPFAINGRFYSQLTTGVQRYAREITLGIEAHLQRSNGRGRIVMPEDIGSAPDFEAMEVKAVGPMKGYLWEQIVLPLRCDEPLLNLCNTGPAGVTRQVVCIHDANVFITPFSYSATFRQTYHILLPLLTRRAMRITSVSEASAQQLATYLPIAARDIVILPNGHEHVFRWDASASRLAAGFQQERPFVLLLGSRALHKNTDLILNQAEALDRLGLDLVLVGAGSGIFSKSDLVVRPNIRHLGTVSDDDLAFLYSRALCLAFPSLTEGFGLPIIEAMALGCPVISSDRASMPEICGQAALLASPDDATMWLSHFAKLAGSAALRDELRGRGREQVRKFSWADSAAGYLGLFGATP